MKLVWSSVLPNEDQRQAMGFRRISGLQITEKSCVPAGAASRRITAESD